VGRAGWIHSARVDVPLAFAWLPFAVLARAVSADVDALATVLGATFLLSFLHQPLTLPLVYGDPAQLAAKRRLFIWSPVVLVVAIVAGLAVSLTAVAIIAGLWNAEHTLMQRYGLTRIYGRKAGQSDGGLEKAMLMSWLVLALVWVASDIRTPDRINALPLGQTNTNGLRVLADLRPWAELLLLPTVAVVVGLLVSWGRSERRRWRAPDASPNPAKLVYLGATAALFGWMLVDPVSGFVGYVGAHAIEYFAIVHRALGSRFADGSGGSLGRTMRRPGGRRRFFGGYVVAFAALVAIESTITGPAVYTFTVLFLGGLHVLYDGFIWKLRRASVARGLVEPARQMAPVASA
jgi:hypothetical protein